MLRKSNLYGSDEPTRLSAGGNAWEVPVPWPNGKAPDCDGALMSMPLEQRQKCTLETRIGPYKPGSMGGACASDRRSGGCFETETAFEKEQAERKVQYENFYSLMQRNVPNLPAFCTIGPNPEKNHGHELGPKVELTTEQVAICINAAEPVIAKQNELAGLNERQQHTKSVEAMMTQISKLPGASTFTTLSTCPKTADCLDDPFQKVWTPWIMADNGEGTKVDMRSILVFRNGWAVVFTGVRGVTKIYQGLHRWAFDCAGHGADITGSGSDFLDIPPNSVLARVSAIVCSTVHVRR